MQQAAPPYREENQIAIPINNRWSDALLAYEGEVTYRQPPPTQGRPFYYERGSIPVLVSAPHGAAHWRNGRLKKEDGFTSAIARFLARNTGAHVLYTLHQSTDDPNWDQRSPYKSELGTLIKQNQIHFVLDIHGMSNRHKIGLAVGTINGRSCPSFEPLILQTIQQHGFNQVTEQATKRQLRLQPSSYVLNHSRFAGGMINHTVTRYVAEQTSAEAAQIEICSTLRVLEEKNRFGLFKGSKEGIKTAVITLIAVICAVQTRLLDTQKRGF